LTKFLILFGQQPVSAGQDGAKHQEQGGDCIMTMIGKTTLGVLAAVAMTGLSVGSANAQATRTWVSGVGDDANPCSRTAPCKTFAGAISKTAAGGEIDCLDPGGFGAVTIVKAMTIDCNGVTGGILSSGGISGVIINAGAADRIILRNLSINGAGSGAHGVRFLAGAQLSIENCALYGFTGNAVDVTKAASGEVYVSNTYITNANKGIFLSTTAGFITAFINDTMIVNATTNGVESASNGVFTTVDNSTIVSAGANGVVVSAGNGQINVGNSEVTGNVTAVNAAISGSLIRISDNLIYNNGTDIAFVAGATIQTNNTNKTGQNSGQVPNGTIVVR
jgi:hypothetical protein